MRRRVLAALAAGLLLLTGCSGGGGLPYAREMGDMALLRTLGVDGDGNSVKVTVSTGRRARGLQREAETPLVLSAERASLSGACLAIQGLSDNYVFYGYVDQLLLGETQSRAGILTVLDYFAQDVELGLGTQAWVIRGRAEDAVWGGGDNGVDSRLATLHTDSEMGAAGMTRTVGETLSQLLEDGSAYLPALSAADGEETTLVEAGYAVFSGERLAGWLEGEAARGLELLENQVSADIFEGNAADGAVLRVTAVRTKVRPVMTGGQLSGVTVRCKLTADVAEARQEVDEDELEGICRQLEVRETARIRAALEQMQQWNADCIGLGRRLGAAAPAEWGRWQEDWAKLFPQLELSIAVEATVRRV